MLTLYLTLCIVVALALYIAVTLPQRHLDQPIEPSTQPTVPNTQPTVPNTQPTVPNTQLTATGRQVFPQLEVLFLARTNSLTGQSVASLAELPKLKVHTPSTCCCHIVTTALRLVAQRD